MRAAPEAKVGALAPDFTLAELQNGQPGPTIALAAQRGHPVLVNFWATWCAPCQAEFPAIDAKYRQYKDNQGLKVLAVDVQGDQGPAAAQKFLGEMGATFPVLLEQDGSVEKAYRIDALPTTVFIDRQGVIRDLVVGGPMTDEYIEKELQKIFQ